MANKHYSNHSACTGTLGLNTQTAGCCEGGYVDPTPFRYYPTCYYFYTEIPVYQFCDCNSPGAPSGWKIIGYIYTLDDVFCMY